MRVTASRVSGSMRSTHAVPSGPMVWPCRYTAPVGCTTTIVAPTASRDRTSAVEGSNPAKAPGLAWRRRGPPSSEVQGLERRHGATARTAIGRRARTEWSSIGCQGGTALPDRTRGRLPDATVRFGAVKFSVTYPLVAGPYDPTFVTGDAIVRFSRAAEAAGFDAISFTDHPAPTDRWLKAGGHDALDPFVALSYCAASTERLHLIPNILVLPYRNPFVVAKAVATLDVLSGGRFILAVATGYLKGEYRALGVDFDERNDLFDEAIEVLRGIWTQDDFAYDGRHFTARGQTANPKPTSPPPLWIGGNSRLSRRRVAAVGRRMEALPRRRSAGHHGSHPSARDHRRPRPDARRALGHGREAGPRSERDRHRLRSERRWRSPLATTSRPSATSMRSASWPPSASPGATPACRATRSRAPSRDSSASASSVIEPSRRG